MPRLLLINPNTSQQVTDLLARHARALAPPGAELLAVTAPFGASYIASEASAAVAAEAVPAAWDAALAAHGPPDAVLVACFGDPGVDALRARTPVPVLGLAEVAMRVADALGRYAIVTGGAAWGPMLQRLAEARGLATRLAGVLTVERSGAELLADPPAAEAVLLDACHRALALASAPAVALHPDDSAGPLRAIVIGGAALADLAAPLAPRLPVPLVDNVRVGLQAAWHAACSSVVSPQTPPTKEPHP